MPFSARSSRNLIAAAAALSLGLSAFSPNNAAWAQTPAPTTPGVPPPAKPDIDQRVRELEEMVRARCATRYAAFKATNRHPKRAPKHPRLPRARYGQFRADEDAFRLGFADAAVAGSDVDAYTIGLNWYLNRFVKAQFNYERTDFGRGLRFGSDTREHEDVLLSRFQIGF